MAETEIKTLDEIIADKVRNIMLDEKNKAQTELKASFDKIFDTISRMQRHGLNDLLDEKEVAEYLGITVSALQSWRTERKFIPYTKLNTKIVRYRLKDILEFVDSNLIKVTRNGEII